MENKLCEICDSNASNLCIECLAYYCESCFKLTHSKKNSQHKKEEIDYILPIETECLDHPKYPKELFCLEEKSKYKLFNLIFFNYITLLRPMPF